jgi:hypothetical protein
MYKRVINPLAFLIVTITGFIVMAFNTQSRYDQPADSSVWFTYTDTCEYEATIFQCHYAAGIIPTEWEWDFAGLGISYLSDPQFHFGQPGQYTVTLNVTDENGNTYNYEKDVTIKSKPEPEIKGENFVLCNNTQNAFFYTNYSSNSEYLWKWDTAQSTLSNKSFMFLDINFDETTLPRQMTLKLVETNPFGCSSETEAHILVTHYSAPPDAIVSQKVLSQDNTILLCLIDNPSYYKYNWGYSEYDPDSHLVTVNKSEYIQDNFFDYNIFGLDQIDTMKYVFWVRIIDVGENNCATTSYLSGIDINKLK